MMNEELNQEKLTINPHDAVGFLHNQGLDYVVKRVNEDYPDIPTNDTLPLKEKVVHYSAEYMVKIHTNNTQTYHGSNDSKDIVFSDSMLFVQHYQHIGTSMNDMELLGMEGMMDAAKMSATSKYLLQDMMEITGVEILAKMAKVEQKIMRAKEEEISKEMLLTLCSIAKHSYKHLEEHKKNEIVPVSNSSTYRRFLVKDTWKEVWKADTKGGFAGIVTGVVKGLFAPIFPAVGAIGISSLGASVAGSAWKLVEEVRKSNVINS